MRNKPGCTRSSRIARQKALSPERFHHRSPDPRAERVQNEIVQLRKTSPKHKLHRFDQQGKQKPVKSRLKKPSRYPHILQIHAKRDKPDDISDRQIGERKPVTAPDQVNIPLKKCQNDLSILTQILQREGGAEYRDPQYDCCIYQKQDRCCPFVTSFHLLYIPAFCITQHSFHSAFQRLQV